MKVLQMPISSVPVFVKTLCMPPMSLSKLVSGASSSECSAVELDDEGGRTFLRVLIHLIMQDYPPLVSGSLQLMFKHFSQRAEVLQAFKQVKAQLVVRERAPDLCFYV